MKHETPTGLYRRFVSRIDGEPIVVLASLTPSKNRKTGPMTQVAIVREDVPPQEAQKTGADYSVCGGCPLRPGRPGDRCYVITAQSILAQWRAYQFGSYEQLRWSKHSHLLRTKVRLGSYGDPTAVPLRFWTKLLECGPAQAWTGYTHHWREEENQPYRGLLMASVSSGQEAAQATLLGWRYFRIRTGGDHLRPTEVVCPASIEAGHKVQCTDCLLCSGTNRCGPNPVVVLHGPGVRRAA